MQPALQSGQIVAGWRRRLQLGDIVVARRGGREIIKRVQKLENGKVYVVGDNSLESTDSRHYGFLNESAILGTIMIVLPKAIKPPKPLKSYGIWLGRILAAVLVVMALVHLFRIDKFIPILDDILPGGSGVAGFVGVVIILTQVFAIPFALRMKLSPLAHVVSGALVVLAPLWWLLIDIWTFGLVGTTGQLSSFVDVPSNVAVLTLNIVWLAFGYYTLYLLGYNNLKIRSVLKK
jgi:hypothetical protein